MASKTAEKTAHRRPSLEDAQETTASQNTTASGGGPSLPILVPSVHVRHVSLGTPNLPSVHVPVPDAVRTRIPDVTENRALWLGGLAVLAATEIISWPVAGVVAVGAYVAERRAKAAAA